MEDVDEGIGSNESSQSNNCSSSSFHDLKGPKSSHVITKDSNGVSQNLNSKLNPNGIFISMNNIPKTNDDPNDIDNNESDFHSVDNETEKLVKEETDVKNNDDTNTSIISVKSGNEMETEVKQESSVEKSSFHIPLDDKLRNSLKGLVAKVKSSEMLKDSANTGDSVVVKDDTNHGITLKDEQENSKDKVSVEHKTKDTYDALLDADGDEDGIFMDIGSDCEDELLSSGSENFDEEKCNTDIGKIDSNKCEDKLDIKEYNKSSKTDSVDNTIEIEECKEVAAVKLEKETKCNDPIKRTIDKLEKNDEIEVNREEQIGIECKSCENTSSEKINDTVSVNFHHKDIPDTNSPVALDNIVSTSSLGEEMLMEVSNESVEKKGKNFGTTVSKPINTSETVCSVNMLANDQDANTKVISIEEDNDVIFQKITKISDTNVPQTNGSKKVVDDDDELPDLDSTNGADISSEEDNDVIFEKITNAKDSSVEKACDKVEIKNGTPVVKDRNVSVKTDTKHVNGITHGSVIDSSDDQGAVVSSSSDRKRAAENYELNANDNKRKKLNLTNGIGKPELHAEPTSIELSDSDDDRVVVTNVHAGKADETLREKPAKKEPKVITVTEEELDSLVRRKVKAYLESQQNTLIATLTQKVKELQTNNDLWKRQVKDLQVKVNEVTVLQQRLEKRKAATNALRQIRTRHVAVQVDNGKTSSHKSTSVKQVATPPRGGAVSVPLVTSPAGTGTIRLPIPQSTYGSSALTTQLTPGNKLITTGYKTPSVKSLLDTTRVQKTVGSVPSTPSPTTVANSVIGLVQYNPNFIAKSGATQGYAALTQALVTQASTISANASKPAAKTITLTSPTAKVIDLTEDDDSKNQTRFLTIPNVNPGMRAVLPPGTQLVRSGLPNNQTYQVVFSPPSAAIRPGTVTVAPALSQSSVPTVLQTLPNQASQQQQTITPGTTMARAAVPAIPPTVVQQPVLSHPAPFPVNTTKHPTAGLKALPPKPSLSISRVSQGIVLSWNMSLNDSHAKISNYQLFAYQETSASPVTSLWKKVGDVKALPLPMACTLTQFQVGNKYHFAVRAVDDHNREGSFSDPSSIHLTPATTQSSK